MKIMLKSAALAAVAVALMASQANAAKLCKLTGSYSDDYGSTTTITGRKGTILNTTLCATAYTFRITDETVTGFTVTGTNKTKSCGKFTATPTFQGSCAVFGGTVTINSLQLSDTFTLITTGAHRRPQMSADLIKGMH